MWLVEELSQAGEDRAKAEGIKERALALLDTREREFAAAQRSLESQLGLARTEVEGLKEQLGQAGAGVETGREVEVDPSVINIRYVRWAGYERNILLPVSTILRLPPLVHKVSNKTQH